MIKKRFALALLPLLLAGSFEGLEAQSAKLFGVTGGATYTGFSSYSRGSKMGGIFGVTAGVRQWNWTVINVEASWAQRGADGVDLDHVDVPLLFGGSSDLGNGVRVRGYTGIQVGYNISCNSTVVGVNCSRINKWQWAWPVGLQIGKYRSGGNFIAADVRYAWFLNDAFDNLISNQRGWEFKLILGKAR